MMRFQTTAWSSWVRAHLEDRSKDVGSAHPLRQNQVLALMLEG